MMTAIEKSIELSAPLELQAQASKPAKVSILAYSGGVMRVPGWGLIAIDLRGLDITATVTLLADHRNELSGIVGQGTASVRGNKLFVEGSISRITETQKQIIGLSKSGFQFQASVGVEPISRKRIEPGESIRLNGGTITAPRHESVSIITRGRLRETTICAIGCDDSTSVAIAARQQRNQTMEGTTDTQGATATQATQKSSQPVNAQHTLNDPNSGETFVQAERQRVLQIESACRDLGVLDTVQVETIRRNAIESGLSASDIAPQLLNLVRAGRTTGPPLRSGPAIHTGTQYGSSSDVFEAACLMALNRQKIAEEVYSPSVLEAAYPLSRMTFAERTKWFMDSIGQPVSGSSSQVINAAVSTNGVTVATSNVNNKVLLETVRQTPSIYKLFCGIKESQNFKTHTGVRPSFLRPLEEIGGDGEIKHGVMQEETYTWSVATFGRMFKVSRKSLIDDDISIFDEVLPLMAKAAMRRLNDLVIETLLAADSSYFDASLNNLVDLPLSPSSLQTVIAAMRNQKDAKNFNVDIEPAVLLVSPDLESDAKGLLQSEYTERIAENTAAEVDAVRTTGNPLRESLKLAVEPRLANTVKFPTADPNDWYLFGRPEDLPMVVAFLDGMQAPTSEFFGMEHESHVLAVTYRIFWDIGCSLADFKAAQKSTGGS